MGWRASTDGKTAARGDPGCAVDYGMQDDSGIGPHANKANPRMVRVPAAGGLPGLPRVFRRRRAIGKRSAPGVRDRYPQGQRPACGARVGAAD